MELFYEIAGTVMASLFIVALFLLIVWMIITLVGLIKDGIDEIKDFKKKR